MQPAIADPLVEQNPYYQEYLKLHGGRERYCGGYSENNCDDDYDDDDDDEDGCSWITQMVMDMEPNPLRDRLIGEYAWAVPSPSALRTIAEYAPRIVEMGAGSGYWARMLMLSGCDVVAYDSYHVGNKHLGKIGHYFTVQQGEPPALAGHADRALLLCWPPYEMDMAVDSLRYYAGNTVVYIGEEEDGCCGTDEFFAELDRHWRQVERIGVPQFDRIYDELFIYARESGTPAGNQVD